ncbi:hypothetical protein BN946_scf184985.g5 [Trametes cinnabarina]|uniref:DUF7330 domain-containing protein n=1 Tax=Pycnoporus cinnabarinus TaxID=5643 RepID=A0A060SED1_PYCCI|nr:hypothetical protein BN946_scf184985.g5 [Trametes cinnabarina]
MILLDDTPESPAKARAALPGPAESVDEDYVAPPPAYPGNPSSSQPPVIEAQAGASQIPLNRPELHVERVERTPKRFLKALGIAILIWIGVGFLVRSAFAVVHWSKYPFPGGQVGDHDRTHGGLPLPRPIDGKVERCVRASSSLQLLNSMAESVISFELPMSADALYIFGRGALSRGSINFMPDEGERPTSGSRQDKVKVDIRTTYEARFALESVNLCLFERTPGQHGIGILTPSGEDHDLDLLNFKIDVRFPLPRLGASPRRVKSFETNLPLFQHNMRDLTGITEFDSISLISRNMPIIVDHLVAKSATVTTSNAVIRGSYNISRSLFIQSSNELVDASVALFNDGSTWSNLTLLNKNGPINSHLSLHSRYRLHAFYDVVAHTENGYLSLPITSAPNTPYVHNPKHPQPLPSSHTLYVDARTSNSPASVELPLTFEGDVDAQTSNSQAKVECDPGAKDPTGLNRAHRCQIVRRSPERVKGSIDWGVAGMRRGNVRVVSWNSPASILSG